MTTHAPHTPPHKTRRAPARPETMNASNWREHRACADTHPDVFIDDDKRVQELAKSICAMCPVKSFCLQFALDTGTKFGVFGGLTPKERDQLLGRGRLPARGHQGNPEPMWQQILRVDARRERLLELHRRGWSAGRIAAELCTNTQTINRVLRELNDQAALGAAAEAVAA